MKRHICIHGHFYQPPRENAWTGKIELQESAHPYHDWNARITAECYRPFGEAHVDRKEKINLYEWISFNFGPTLLTWLEEHEPKTYQKILRSDENSRRHFNGFGSAIAQAYNHIIMPLANARDKETQVKWGIRDFEHRFKRKPVGMWLPETAVDVASLEVLARNKISFTILSPFQARRFKRLIDKQWTSAEPHNFETSRPYVCLLPSGKTIRLFFYNGNLAQGIAFGGFLHNGDRMTEEFIRAPIGRDHVDSLVHVATDGETYGHHHKHSERALARLIQNVQEMHDVYLTVYEEFLYNYLTEYEVEIVDGSAWSCSHGVERWRSNCGCRLDTLKPPHQEWRAPLREALDVLRDGVSMLFEEHVGALVSDAWALRNSYIDVLLDPSEETKARLLKSFQTVDLTAEQEQRIWKWMELQKFAMFMYTSCGWFFDDISRIETVQILQYAARVIELTQELTGQDLEDHFLSILGKAKSHELSPHDGRWIYQNLVKKTVAS